MSAGNILQSQGWVEGPKGSRALEPNLQREGVRWAQEAAAQSLLGHQGGFDILFQKELIQLSQTTGGLVVSRQSALFECASPCNLREQGDPGVVASRQSALFVCVHLLAI